MAQSKKRQSPKGKAPVKKQNKWLMPTGITAVAAVVLVVAIFALKGGGAGNGTTDNVGDADTGAAVVSTVQGTGSASSDVGSTAQGADLVIPISEISTTAQFYPVEVDGTKFEVLAVEAPDGTIRTAFNTCEVCYDSGRGYYEQSGDRLVCQNCGNRFAMNRVEIEAGGCNPWPIFSENKTVTDETITISAEFLAESKGIFANWKREY
jgi:hypothetical protein